MTARTMSAFVWVLRKPKNIPVALVSHVGYPDPKSAE
jgi:hypothetical protein